MAERPEGKGLWCPFIPQWPLEAPLKGTAWLRGCCECEQWWVWYEGVLATQKMSSGVSTTINSWNGHEQGLEMASPGRLQEYFLEQPQNYGFLSLWLSLDVFLPPSATGQGWILH